MTRTRRNGFILALAWLATAGLAGAAQRAILVFDQGDANQSTAAARIRNFLTPRGFTTDDSGSVPGNLSDYCCAWDLRAFTTLSGSDISRYVAFLDQGHGLFLAGENQGCCQFRDDSIESLIASAGGGAVRIDRERPGTFSEPRAGGHAVVTTPNNIGRVSYDGIAASIFDAWGNGTILTEDPGFAPSGSRAAAAWSEGDLTGTPDGRLVVVLDINFLVDVFSLTDNTEFVENISHFLCPTTAANLTVNITSPASFLLECPNTVTVQGVVDGTLQDCKQPTTFTAAATRLPAAAVEPPGADNPLLAGGPGDSAQDAAQQATTIEGVVDSPLYTTEGALLAGQITSIRYSINGGPYSNVTSTSPGLPADPPVSFTAAGLPLRLGGNTIEIEARDDQGRRATDTVSGTLRDTRPPVIDPATCQDLVVDLGPGCRLDYSGVPLATDLCDPTLTFTASPPLPIVFTGPGTASVAYEVRDDSGNKANCSRNVTTRDISGPVLTCAPPTTVECRMLGGTPASDPGIVAFLAATTAVDNCAMDTLAHDAPAFFTSGCPPGLATSVTWTATDKSLNKSTCSADLRVQDSTPPSFTSKPAALTLECNSVGGVTRSDPAIAAWLQQFQGQDVCSSVLTGSDDAPLLLPSGCTPGLTTTVSYTLEDDCANPATASEKITVIDTTPPTIVVPAPLLLECNGPGGVLRSDPAVQGWLASAGGSDICGGITLADNAPALLPSGCSPGTSTPVTFTVSDACGHPTSAPSSVTVRDTTPPSLSVPAPLVLECNGPGGISRSDPAVQAWLGAATTADLCGTATLSNTAPALLPSGCGAGQTTTVAFTSVDDCGNTVTKTSTITVRDTTKPSLGVPAPLVLECNGPGGVLRSDPAVQAWLAAATASDVCDGATIGNDAPALLPSGCGAGTTTTVAFTATDNCGNATTITSTVTVRDTTRPTLVVPAPLVLECNGPGGVLRSDPAVQAWLASAVGSDVCGSVTITDTAPALLPSGCGAGSSTPVDFTATDSCGLSLTLRSTITVKDTTAPTLSVPAPLLLECDGPGGIQASDPRIQRWLAAATASDLCDGATLTNDAPAFFPSGCGAGQATTVTFQAVDNCGNLRTATATLTVRDTTPPALTVPAPLVLECNGPGGVPATDPAIVAWLAAAAASDVCDGASITHDAPALFPSGCGAGLTTTVTFTAVDNCGNARVLTSAITVRDTTAPALSVPAPLTLECSAPGGIPASDPRIVAWLASAAASDVCDGAAITHDAPAFFPSGCAPGTTTTVTFTATDNCGNATVRRSSITVADTLPPEIGKVDFEGACLWPPNHNFWCVDDIATAVEAHDVCDPNPGLVAVTGCRSSQPEDSTGDGDFAPDCLILASGKGFCVRSERQGEVPEGRVYTITISATDGCNNSAEREVEISVPHDSSPKLDCKKPNAGKDPRR